MEFYPLLFGVAGFTGFLTLALAIRCGRSKGFGAGAAGKLLLILGSLIFSVAGIEAALLHFLPPDSRHVSRFPPMPPVFDNNIPFTRVQNSILYLAPPENVYQTYGYPINTNFLGFRERNFSLKKPPGVRRILVFGDSFTFGVGVFEGHRYTNRLETMLNAAAKGTRYEILNFGMPGFSIDQERDLMEAVLNLVECDLAIIGVFSNDLEMTTQKRLQAWYESPYLLNREDGPVEIFNNGRRRFDTLPPEEPKTFHRQPVWYEKTRLFRFLELRTNLNRGKKRPTPKRWAFALNEFLEMKSLTRQHGLPPPVVVLIHSGAPQPEQNDFVHPKGELAQNLDLLEFVGAELKRQGFIVADPLPWFQQYSGMGLTVSEWETHSNPLAHYLYAQSLSTTLLANNLL